MKIRRDDGPAIPFAMAVAQGWLPGFAKVNKFGHATDCDSGIATDIWDGADGALSTDVWVPPTAARIHAIASSDVNDVAAGSGTGKIKVYGLASWDTAETSEDVVMDGTNDVNTQTAYVIIHRMHPTDDAVGVNAGDITATAATDGTITAAILAGETQTQMAIYGIPSTQTLQISCARAQIVKLTGGTARIDVDILMMPDPATNAVANVLWIHKEHSSTVSGSAGWEHCYEPYKSFSGPCIVKLQVVSTADGTQSIGSFDAYIVDKS